MVHVPGGDLGGFERAPMVVLSRRTRVPCEFYPFGIRVLCSSLSGDSGRHSRVRKVRNCVFVIGAIMCARSEGVLVSGVVAVCVVSGG